MATAREEAERLVAAALAAAQFASRAARRNSGSNARSARDSGNDMFEDLAGLANIASKFLGASGFGGPPPPQPQAPEKHHVIANGSDECCICPVCRAIAAVRDPSPEFAEKLATGASDLAAGLTSILRAFGEAARRTGRPIDADLRPPVEAETVAPAQRVAESIDEAAVGGVPVTEPEAEPEPVAEPEDASPWPSWSDFGNVWRAATRVQDEPVSDPGPGDAASAPAPAKKTVAKKAAAKKTMAKKTVAKKTVAKKTVAKKTVAKKAQPAAENVGSRPADAVKASAPAKKTAAKTAVKKAAPAKKAAAKKTAKKATPSASEPKKAQ
jgi:hypothetical protein